MDDKTKRHLRAVLDAHDGAFRALRDANNAIGAVVQAHDDAIKSALAANQAVVDLLEDLSGR